MRKLRIKQVDAFTDRIFSGNPAGVVPSAEGLTDQEMQQIANEMNLSETAFVLPSKKADFRIRWFTPKTEVLFCGHATVASLHVLAEEDRFGMDNDGTFSFRIETKVGILNVDVEKNMKSTKVILQSPPIDLVREELNRGELAAALRIRVTDIDSNYPIMRDRTLDYVYIPLRKLETLRQLGYDFDQLKSLGNRSRTKGFTILTKETFDRDSMVHSRFFSPYYGVREDPTTGSSHGPLAVYLIINHIVSLDSNHEAEIKAEQGDIMGRPGRLVVKLKLQKDGIYSTKLVSRAVTVLHGEFLLP